MLARSAAVLAVALSASTLALAAPPEPPALRPGQRPPPDIKLPPIGRGPASPPVARQMAPSTATSFLAGPVSLTPASPEAPGAALITLGRGESTLGSGIQFSIDADGDSTPGVRFLGLAGRTYAVHCTFSVVKLRLSPSPPDGALRAKFWLSAPDAAPVSAKTFVVGGLSSLSVYWHGEQVSSIHTTITGHVSVATPRLPSAGEVSFTFRPDPSPGELSDFLFQGCDVQPSG